MRVLMIVTEKLPVPPVRGGAIQTYVAAVAPMLARHHDLTILGVTDPTLPDKEKVDGVTYVRVPGGEYETYRKHVGAFLRQNPHYDLIHVFNRPRMVLTARKWAPNARVVLSMHNDMFELTKITPTKARKAIAHAQRIVTVSDYVGKRVSSLYPDADHKRRTVYSGVDLKRFEPGWSRAGQQVRNTLREQHNLKGKKVILFVGRLSPKKGADVLVRAMDYLAKQQPDTALVLVGSKWYGEDKISDYVAYVRALAARSPIPVVTTGFVTPDQVHQWFAVGDVFVCPSLWEEPLARVHYEAMAAGLPIVTTARGGNPEVVQGQGNGVVVETPEDPKAMADAIASILSDSGKRERMARTGRALAEQRFGWERVAQEILDIWSGR